MEQQRPASERVRPILQAMERSIDAARQRRLYSDSDLPADSAASTATATPTTVPAPQQTIGGPVVPADPSVDAIDGGEATTPRLKARPKRPSAFGEFGDDVTLHSRAG